MICSPYHSVYRYADLAPVHTGNSTFTPQETTHFEESTSDYPLRTHTQIAPEYPCAMFKFFFLLAGSFSDNRAIRSQ